MAKSKPTNRGKDQPTITKFFAKPKQNENEKDTALDGSQSDASDVEDDVDEVENSGKLSSKLPPDQSDHSPINDLPSIFQDLVRRLPNLETVVDRVKGRKLRVATMCSGTESPLLALGLISRSIKEELGRDLEYEHVFSCEIEPFKQAYIERNFKPPILFRDVCELGNEMATNAYGSRVAVPGNVDILIAGTSCVDYSNLNNEKKDIDAGGESGQTFRGMLSWVSNHRPPLVILENVCGAPWDKVQSKFAEISYSADFMRLDTKQFYIPHTRTRVYLLAVDKKRSDIPGDWTKMMKSLYRPASSSLDAFLLPSDDPRIHQAREKFVQENSAVDRRGGRTDWGRCESRHQRARIEEELGSKRPLTSWDEGGYCTLPDYGWNDWAVLQVERVWDLMDISYLRALKENTDPSSKTQVWNLSQNVDRNIGSRLGISPCLTPSMIPYITNRGGPMIGIEALSLQGLPVDELLLTRETEDNLADLAGNAMSTTVVGTAIMSALILGHKLLDQAEESEDSMIVDKSLSACEEIVGEEQLETKTLDLGTMVEHSLESILANANRSARLCICEGRAGMTNRPIRSCQDCGTTTCVKCGGRPEHNCIQLGSMDPPRIHPTNFAAELKAALPMCLKIQGADGEYLDKLKDTFGAAVQDKNWKPWRAAAARALTEELRFVELKRQEVWVACYDSLTASLQLVLHPKRAEWRLFGKPEASVAANSFIRKLLALPIARFVCHGKLLDGSWEFALPQTSSFDVEVKGVGELVPSWESLAGLQGATYKDRKVYSQLEVSIPEDKKTLLDRDISGTYKYLPQCGTAHSSLHKKLNDDDSLPALFFFLDPTRTGEPSEDPFVFATSIRRYEYGETRPVLCTLDPKWRQSDTQGSQTVKCHVPCVWFPADEVKFVPSERPAKFGLPANNLEIPVSTESCAHAHALLTCEVALHGQAGSEWPTNDWKEVDDVHARTVYRSLAWIIERFKSSIPSTNQWVKAQQAGPECRCERCAPSPPGLLWVETVKKIKDKEGNTKATSKMKAFEDSSQAGTYEQALKHRPSAFITQLKLDSGIGYIRFGVNITSLIHRALSRLPTENRTEAPWLSWKLTTDYRPPAKLQLPKFNLSGNKKDPEHAQPKHFVIPLRKEQARSLSWMVHQESLSAPFFTEEEIAEAILDPLGWRAEGRAQRHVRIRGGVLADEVGYGKTATSLALIDVAPYKKDRDAPPKDLAYGRIPVTGTLIIVPPHLTKQWASEVKKFCGDHFEVVVISTAAKLNALTIQDVCDADIVIVASNLFRSSVYLENLAAFSAVGGSLPTAEGRYFDARLKEVIASLKKQVELLKKDGATAVYTKILEAEQKNKNEPPKVFLPSARRKHKQNQAANGDATDDAPSNETSADEKSIPHVTSGRAPSRNLRPEVLLTSFIENEPPKVFLPSTRRKHKQNQAANGDETDDAPSNEASADEKPIPHVTSGRAPSRNLKLEVLVPRLKRCSSVTSAASAASDVDSDGELKAPSRRAKRSTRQSNVSYHESGDEDVLAVASSSTNSTSDYDEEEAGYSSATAKDDMLLDDDDDFSEDELVSEEESKYKAKTKAKPKTQTKPKPKAKSKSKVKTRVESDDEMDVDDAPKTGKKRKSTALDLDEEEDEEEKPKKKPKKDPKPKISRAIADPWKLKSSSVKKDWKEMKVPALEMFHFYRTIIDEYTYLDGKTHSLITNLQSTCHWVLSGTPPVHDFPSLKTIAVFLGIHLGIDDDVDEKKKRGDPMKKRKNDQTQVEKFHSFREVHSLEWHAHRHQVGQGFLDQFVRQNKPEIDEIPETQHIVSVTLPAAERAIYLELEHHLRALDMTIKRSKKTESDRDNRLQKVLGESSSAEEALLKRCSHFDLDMTEKENAMKACEVIVKDRKKQLDECRDEFIKEIREALEIEKKIGKVEQESLFREFIRNLRTEGSGDKEATELMLKALETAGVKAEYPLKTSTNTVATDKGKVQNGKPKTKPKGDTKPQALTDLIWEHREHAHEIRKLAKELTGRVRSLRYFTVVRDLQKQDQQEVQDVHCPRCGRQSLPISEIGVLSSCGHMGCISCVLQCADGQNEECVYHASGECDLPAKIYHVVKAETLGVDDVVRDGKGKHFGRKLEQVVDLIKGLPKKERVLIFVQFADLMKKVCKALAANGIKFLEIKGTASQMSNALERFQQQEEEQVLLLNVIDESASGANLTVANHAIFLSPLLTPTQEIYDARETQAIGRLRRFGQTKMVHIYRFLTSETIDTEIFVDRTKVASSSSHLVPTVTA
ncbi:hypothetical protein M422DRAFT_240196 [Sphaerobolus stellatus SS14]|nr:hypothetical protein M422DRAFT_240196 [Sphaerobolus stellatus SS14]